MQLAVVLEIRFDVAPDGSVWTPNAFPRPFWDRYLDVFDEVVVVARGRQVSAVPEGGRRVDGDQVRVVPLPYYVGAAAFLTQAHKVRRALADALAGADAVILRAPGTLSNMAFPILRKTGQPFGMEVVGDPHDVFAPGVVTHPARPLLRAWFVRNLKRQCQAATTAAYVTEQALQRRYPAGPQTWATHYSSVELPPEAFVDAPRRTAHTPVQAVTVASLDQPYKGIDTLIEAAALLKARGVEMDIRVVGEGRLHDSLVALAAERGVGDRVRLTGGLPGAVAVREALDAADLFVLASRTEGLPRGMIEAMARGLACVGTHVGGIPELLPPDECVPPDSPAALADALARLGTDPALRQQHQDRNLERARLYAQDALAARRREGYRRLRAAAEGQSVPARPSPISPIAQPALA